MPAKFFLALIFIACAISNSRAEQRPEIWIALRTDGQAGTGTAANPFDGSTSAKLDRVLRTALNTAQMKIHFGPGTFLTKGVLAEEPVYIGQPFVTILGAGMYRTTLALDPSVGRKLPAWAFSVLQTDQHIVPDSHLTVQDMTFDTNWPKLDHPRKDISISDLSLTGGHCSIIRVRGLNAHGDHATGKECFGISIGCGGPYDIHDALIADCVVKSAKGDYVNGITINGWTFDVYPATTASGIIRGCKVFNLRADHKHMAAYGLASGTVTDCYADNSTIGVYMECARDLTISNCTFMNNTWRGVWVCPANGYGGVRNVRVMNSTIETSNFFDGAAGIEVGRGDAHNETEDVLLSGNTFLCKTVQASHKAYSMITAIGIPGLSVVGNRIDSQLNNSLVRDATMLDNKSLTGAKLSALPDVVVTEKRTEFLQSRPKRKR